jgi:hypothetical protein
MSLDLPCGALSPRRGGYYYACPWTYHSWPWTYHACPWTYHVLGPNYACPWTSHDVLGPNYACPWTSHACPWTSPCPWTSLGPLMHVLGPHSPWTSFPQRPQPMTRLRVARQSRCNDESPEHYRRVEAAITMHVLGPQLCMSLDLSYYYACPWTSQLLLCMSLDLMSWTS